MGIEGDFSWTSVKDEIDFGCLPKCKEKIPYFATVRLRGGYAVQNTLLYLTAGAAFTRAETWQEGTGRYLEKDATGWTVGAGWETAISPNWSWKAEYLFADFGDPVARTVWGIALRHDLQEHIVRVGVNYRFGSN
jgi:outer membrane immunogenic protein